MCNFSKPTPKKPSLLKHNELVVLFHELGHGIHDLVSKTAYACFHGTNTVQDFGEAPSQMLENWAWTPAVLKLLSCHYSYLSPEYHPSSDKGGIVNQPKKIDDKMIQQIIDTKHVNAALFYLRQLHLAIFDMTVHAPETHEYIESLNIPIVYNKLRKEMLNIDGPEVLGESEDWGYGYASIGHFMGGYDAGYYGYLM